MNVRALLISVFFLSAVFTIRGQQRIVSLNGNVSEILCALGLEQQIVGVDVTSNYPASLQSKPKVGHNRNISAENILSLQPTLVLGVDNQMNPALPGQLKSASIKTEIFKEEVSVDGIRKLLEQVAAVTGATSKATTVRQQFDKEMAAIPTVKTDKKLLFIYARGAGTLMVSGTGTPVEKVFQLAGAKNAVTDFADYKPLTAESLVAANPDVIVLFDSGLASVGGVDGLLKIPGIAQTNAGRNKNIISMDGELLSGFGLRLPQAIRELQSKIK